MGMAARLGALVAVGMASYAALLFVFARPALAEVAALLRPARGAPQTL
jgi:hypothetical protein